MIKVKNLPLVKDELLEKNFMRLSKGLSLNNEGKNLNCFVQKASTLELK